MSATVAPPRNLTPKRKPEEWQPAFLATLAHTANVSAAAKVAGITRPYAYQARERSRAFALAWDDAMEQATDELEQEARDRAKRESDTLLIFLLKAHRPDKYRDTVKQVHSGDPERPIRFLVMQPPNPPAVTESSETNRYPALANGTAHD